MNNNHKKNKGFTLAEVMIVFAIIAVVTIISIKISKSRANYETSFMTYSAFTNLQHAVGEIVADGYIDAGGNRQTGLSTLWTSTANPIGFCQRLADSTYNGVFNIAGAIDCSKTATDATDFSLATTIPMFTLTNGQRFFHDSTNTTYPYTIYIDINGKNSTKKDTLYKDVLKFIVNSDGTIYPVHTAVVADKNAADNTNYLKATVRYRDSSGNMIVIDQGVDFYTATCDATGNYYGTGACTKNANCNSPNICEVIINRPGF